MIRANVCPKCGSHARPAKWHGKVHLRCADRQCGFHVPMETAMVMELDRGLSDVKVAVVHAEGLSGLKTPETLFGDDFSSPTASAT